MYSRNHYSRSGDTVRLPAHYSGVAFAHPRAESEERRRVDAGCCAAGLPGSDRAALAMETSSPIHSGEQSTACADEHKENPQTGTVSGLFGGIGQEELLLLGVIFLLAQRPGEDDTILLLLLLLLRH